MDSPEIEGLREPGRTADVGAAPPAADPELRRLDPRIVMVWRAAALVRTAVAAAIALGAESVLELPVPTGALAAPVLVAGVLLVIFWPPAQYRAWGYTVRERDLFVRRGVLWRITSIVPHVRIQHVDTQRGPLERLLGLARVVVYTAGIRGADVTIPGLSLEEAEALRDRLAALGGEDDGV